VMTALSDSAGRGPRRRWRAGARAGNWSSTRQNTSSRMSCGVRGGLLINRVASVDVARTTTLVPAAENLHTGLARDDQRQRRRDRGISWTECVGRVRFSEPPRSRAGGKPVVTLPSSRQRSEREAAGTEVKVSIAEGQEDADSHPGECVRAKDVPGVSEWGSWNGPRTSDPILEGWPG
jgi:hypothetical protein